MSRTLIRKRAARDVADDKIMAAMVKELEI
jgi:hypothetical protein